MQFWVNFMQLFLAWPKNLNTGPASFFLGYTHYTKCTTTTFVYGGGNYEKRVRQGLAFVIFPFNSSSKF